MKCKLLNFLKCLIDERCLMLFLARTMATYSHYCILGTLRHCFDPNCKWEDKIHFKQFSPPICLFGFYKGLISKTLPNLTFFHSWWRIFFSTEKYEYFLIRKFFENKYLSQSEKISSPEKYFPFSKVSQTVNPQIASILWVRFQYFWLLSVYLKHGLAYCSPVSPSSPN